MAFYIKANEKVARFLNLEDVRLKLGDGNYMLWQADMLAFGPLYELPQTCRRIGALALQPHEAKEEQTGVTVRALPTAEDGRFTMEPATESETEAAPGSDSGSDGSDDSENHDNAGEQ